MRKSSLKSISINGKLFMDFESVTIGTKTIASTVQLMNSYDAVKQAPEHTFSIVYVPRSGVSLFPFETELDGQDSKTVKFLYDDNSSILWGGVSVLSVDDTGLNGKDANKITYNCHAKTRANK